ncbi:SGNH/GDSL hydrolase family protein [bacterium]|nr:SGNH/GDSL hydrolase family protein [bacterium]
MSMKSVVRLGAIVIAFGAFAALWVAMYRDPPPISSYPPIAWPYRYSFVALVGAVALMRWLVGGLVVGEVSESRLPVAAVLLGPLVGTLIGVVVRWRGWGDPYSPALIVALSATASGLTFWAFLIRRRKSLRFDAALLLWPILVFVLAEMCAVTFRIEVAPEPPEMREVRGGKLRWRIAKDTNLSGRYDDAHLIPDAFDELVPVNLPKKTRIVALGTSSTYGQGLADPAHEAWPAALERDLPERYTVFNAGCGGYNSFQLLLYYQQVLVRLSPSVVVFYYGGNEAFGDEGKPVYARLQKLLDESKCESVECRLDVIRYGSPSRLGRLLSKGIERSILLDAYRQSLLNFIDQIRYAERRRTGKLSPVRLPPLPLEILGSLAEATEAGGTRLLLVPEVGRPNIFAGTGKKDGEQAAAREPDFMAQVAAEHPHVEYFDVRSIFSPEAANRLFIDTTHLTAEGSTRLARAIGEKLRSLGWIEDEKTPPGS